MINATILESLERILGSSNLTVAQDKLEQYSSDALAPSRAFGALPLLNRTTDVVVKPNSTEKVLAIITLAAAHKIPLIPYGGGTGVMGGINPVNGGITVDLRGLNRILEIRSTDRTATVEAGVLLEHLAQSLYKEGLMLGHDPWSVPIATVGGAIATNGIGYRAASVGSMGAQVLGLEVIIPSGQVLTTQKAPYHSGGPNLSQFFVGSEGAFGIITKATIRVFRQPEKRIFSTFQFSDFDHGFEALVELFAIGMRPAVVDLTEDSDGVYLYLVLEGYTEGVAAQLARIKRTCKTFNGENIGSTKSKKYWATRYEIADHYKEHLATLPRRDRWRRMSKPSDYLHVALPISQVLEYRRRCAVIFEEHHIRVAEHAIWTQPELYSMILVPEEYAKQSNMSAAVDEALMLSQDMGGAMEYCHGVGIKLGHLMARELGVGLDTIREIKKALDPHHIMNPGKLGI